MPSFGILRSVEWWFLTDFSEQPIGSILTLADGTDMLSRNAGNKLLFYGA